MIVDDTSVWLPTVDVAAELLRKGEFESSQSELLKALDAIEGVDQGEDWKLFNNGYACDHYLNTLVKIYYDAKPDTLISYCNVCLAIAERGRFFGTHQSQFTLNRLFDIALELFRAGNRTQAHVLFEKAFCRYADAFSDREALVRLQTFAFQTDNDAEYVARLTEGLAK